MSKIALAISLTSLLLSACAFTANILPTANVTFITATVGLPQIQPTYTYANTLTPLPAQAHAMTQAAKITPDPYTRIVVSTQTDTPTKTATSTLNPSDATGTAIAKARAATVAPTAACRPDYPDFCVPYGHRKTCKEWRDLGYDNFTVRKPDSLNYDKNADGIGCNE